MKTLIATLLATAAGATFAAAPTFGLNHDVASYRNLTAQATAAYQAAVAKCEGMKGNAQDVCMAEARLSRTRAESQALSRYNTSPASQLKVRTELANAEYSLAKARCDGKSGAEKDDCLNSAKSVYTAAIADAKAGRPTSDATTSAGGATGALAATGLVTTTDTRDPAKSAAVEKCAQSGDAACLVQTKPSAVRENAAEAASVTVDKTKTVAAKAAEKTKEVAHVVVEKTKEVAAVVAQKAGTALDRTGEQAKATAKATGATAAAADVAITSKVKANLVKEKDLESLGIHVETEKGVVMLSGFVNSNAEAEKAVTVAKGVDGVANVKSAIQVK